MNQSKLKFSTTVALVSFIPTIAIGALYFNSVSDQRSTVAETSKIQSSVSSNKKIEDKINEDPEASLKNPKIVINKFFDLVQKNSYNSYDKKPSQSFYQDNLKKMTKYANNNVIEAMSGSAGSGGDGDGSNDDSSKDRQVVKRNLTFTSDRGNNLKALFTFELTNGETIYHELTFDQATQKITSIKQFGLEEKNNEKIYS